MAENNIPITIDVETKGASKDLDAFEKNVSKSIGGLEKTFGLLKLAAGAAVAVFAGKQLIDGLSRAVSAASEADEAVQKLNLALASTGEFTEKNSLKLQKFAKDMQAATTVSDDAVVAGLALAKTFGVTNQEAEKLVKAAVDLSAATGEDLDGSIQKLGSSLSGVAPRIPQLKGEFRTLTEEQLKSGKAIDIVAEKYLGFAEGLTKTFGGAVKQAQNNFDDIFESVGKIITQNPVVIAIINKVSQAFATLATFIEDNQTVISTFVSVALQKMIIGFEKTLQGAAFLTFGFSKVIDIIGAVFKAFVDLERGALKPVAEFLLKNFANNLINAFELVKVGVSGLIDFILRIADAVPGVSKSFQDFGIDIKGMRKEVEDFNRDAVKDLLKNNDQLVDQFVEVRKKAQDATIDGFKSLSSGAKDTSKKIRDFRGAIFESTTAILNIDPASKAAGASLKNIGTGSAKALGLTKEQLDNIKKATQEFTDKNITLQAEIDNIGRDQFDTLKGNLQLELDRLAVKREQLRVEGSLTDDLSKRIDRTAALLKLKADKQTEQIPIGDLAVKNADEALKRFASAFDISKIAESFGKLTLKEISAGIESVFTTAANTISGILSGEFVKISLNFVQALASFPKTLLDTFKEFGTIFQEIAETLPRVISKIINKLPTIAIKIADSLGKIFTKIADNLPKIAASLVDSLIPLISVVFKKIIPTLIEALPGLIEELAKALGPIVRIIAESLPRIITAIFDAIPEIVKSLADAIPDIIEGIADNADKIVLSLVDGLISSMPEIVESLINSLLIEGGLERIVKALINAMPRVALALVQGVLRGIAHGGEAIGRVIARGFGSAVENIGAKIAQPVTAAFSSAGTFLLSGLTNVFRSAGGVLTQSLGTAFSSGGQTIFSGIVNGFNTILSGLGTAFTQGASQIFNAIFEGALNLYQEAFAGIKRGALKIFEEITAGFEKGANFVFDKLKEAFNIFGDFVDDLKNSLKGGGGGTLGKLAKGDFSGAGKDILNVGKGGGSKKGPVTGVKGSPIATGGLIPRGFPNDTFPARLTSGELVVPTAMVTQLGDFLKNQTESKPSASQDLLVALLQQITNKLSEPMTVETKAEINNREFANIILNLSRSNARLSA